MVKLFCALVDVKGSAFPVNIDASECVGDLKDAIKAKNEDIKCPARKLQLFLAWKNGAWLESCSNDVEKLKQGELTTAIEELTKENKQLQGEDGLQKVLNGKPPPKLEQIHVLVLIPEGEKSGITAGPMPLNAETLKMAMNEVLTERDEKASVYSFSKLNSEKRERLVKKMRLSETIPYLKEPVDTSIAGYTWISEVEESGESQRAGYMAYLQQHLKMLIDQGFQLVDIAGDHSALSIKDPRLPFGMKGTADVLLRLSNNPLIMLAGISLVIELKKKVALEHLPQAIGQLVSCSMKAPNDCYPASLLTDLNDHWHFSWFSGKHELTQLTLQYPKNAFQFIEAAALNRTKSPPRPPSFIPGPITILKVDEFLPQPVDANAEEMMERYELMADVVEPEFLAARRMEYGQHMVQSMPMYAHMFA
ncbi:hypothetical protein PsorP6_014246 [Peronosclerospora sorghi]|uniref:Uncharacterized protein n=1 Tax=Peronosclerospora sorghi TaxID=230839 RepID=A0ACC0VHR7_9STRA|nr:hypothetical protein PsorP6_014246 [Peronosclerospora sorghi]